MVVTAELVRALLTYEATTGVFTWRFAPCKNIAAGAIAGKDTRQGYRKIGLHGKHYLAHRLAWLYVFGRWPAGDLDHINRVKADNRIANLREVTRAENMQNSLKHSNNTSGFKGVSYSKQTRKFVASIRAGKKRGLGHFETAHEAAQAYAEAATTLHKYNPSAAA